MSSDEENRLPGGGELPGPEERNWAVLCHLSCLLIIVTLGIGVIAPLLLWLFKRDSSAFIDDQGRESVNFAITLLLGAIACIPFYLIGIGLVMIALVYGYCFIFAIVGALSASRGENYRYPLSLRLIN